METKWYKLASAVLGTLIGSACGETVDSGGSGGAGAAAGNGGTGLSTSTGTGTAVGTGGMTAEYGMPSAHYVVSGTVVADDGGQPIEGIEVTFDETMNTTTTDANGDFTLSADSYAFCSSDPCAANLTAADVDGAANGGEFETTAVAFTLQQTEPGGGTWDDGTWEAQDVDVSMPDAAGGSGGSGGGSGGAGGS